MILICKYCKEEFNTSGKTKKFCCHLHRLKYGEERIINLIKKGKYNFYSLDDNLLYRIWKVKLKSKNVHHLDSNEYNNLNGNLIVLTKKQHSKVHTLAYRYIVRLGKVEEYLQFIGIKKLRRLTI